MLSDEVLSGLCERRNELIGKRNEHQRLFPRSQGYDPSHTLDIIQAKLEEVSLAINYIRREIPLDKYAKYELE